MPAMADITVKKNDGTTDIVYAAMTPSSGDNVAAFWRSTAAAAPYAGLKPDYKMSTRWNGAKDARRCDLVGTYTAYATDSTTTVSSSIGKIVFTGSWAIPQQVSQTDIDEAVSQLSNILTSSLIRSALKAGFAPT